MNTHLLHRMVDIDLERVDRAARAGMMTCTMLAGGLSLFDGFRLLAFDYSRSEERFICDTSSPEVVFVHVAEFTLLSVMFVAFLMTLAWSVKFARTGDERAADRASTMGGVLAIGVLWIGLRAFAWILFRWAGG